MSQLVRARHPKIILGVVGAALAVPVLGITISLAGVNANTPQDVSMQEVSMQEVSMQEVSMQDVSMQDVSMEESAQNEVSAQHETVPTVAATSSVVVESQPAQSPLPDPLAPEPSRDRSPSVSASLSETQEPSSKPKATKTPEPPVMNESKTVKKTTQVVGGWTAPVVNPGTVSLRAPQISSGQRVTLTVACSPSVNCVINGDQLTMTEGTQVTVTYRAKATSTHTAWTTIIRS
jgi:cytoskeletal protein RodZ